MRNHSISMLLLVILTTMSLFSFSGCNTSATSKQVRNPMHASLDWLTAESGPVRVVNDLPNKWAFDFFTLIYMPLGFNYSIPWRWEQRTLVSVGGGLPMPLIGDAYYWEEDASPVTALRVFEPESCVWFEGTIPPKAESEQIFAGKRALETLQS